MVLSHKFYENRYFLLLNIKEFKLYQKLIIYFISAYIFAYFADFSMSDDGLRHIAFAAYPDIMKSWGDVFPHSLFMKDYDPWHIWHYILALYLQFFSYDVLHVAINTSSLFLLMILTDLILTKYSKVKFGTLSIIIVLSIVVLGSSRYINLRPDLLSGLYLMGALLLTKRPIFLFSLTLLYAPSYYLFFLYTGSMGLVYLVLKEHKAFASVFIASCISLAIHLYLDGQAFVQTIIYLLTDQSLRMGLEVAEGKAVFEFLKIFNYYVLVFILGSIIGLIVYKNYNYFKKQPLALLLLITSILWITQVRYFLLLLPLMILYIVIEIKPILKTIFSRPILYYLFKASHTLKLASKQALFYLVAIPYAVVMLGLTIEKDTSKEALENKAYFKNEIFNNKRILLNSLRTDIYVGLYLNPSLEFIPSCSIGWFENNKKMKDIYIRMMKDDGINKDELKQLLDFVEADYYMHIFSSKKQILDIKELNKIGLKSLLIIDNKLLFKYEP